MQITQNFNNQQLIDVGLNLSDYKFGQEHKGKYVYWQCLVLIPNC